MKYKFMEFLLGFAIFNIMQNISVLITILNNEIQWIEISTKASRHATKNSLAPFWQRENGILLVFNSNLQIYICIL